MYKYSIINHKKEKHPTTKDYKDNDTHKGRSAESIADEQPRNN